jgi:formylglycine-generating enzyme required for sulfatase activity
MTVFRPLPAKFAQCAAAALTLFLSAETALPSDALWRNSLGMEFVLIPPGVFMMGSPSGEPHRSESEGQHQVALTRFYYLQKTEVTLGQWRALMGRRLFGGPRGGDRLPVTKVSWHDAQKFIEKLNRRDEGCYRLPTEAEWEYACRAGSKTGYAWGETIDCGKAMYGNSKKLAECAETVRSRGLAFQSPAPVMSYAPNAWGLYDMHGNVWEWCQDVFQPYDLQPATDPLVEQGGRLRVRRGGSWFKHGYSCRSANRAFGHPASRLKTTGFRVVREVKMPE